MEEKSKEEEEARSKKTVAEYIKRCLFLIVGLCIMAVGVVLSIKAALGTSPISSIPYVLNLITGLTVGTTTIIVNTLIVLLQIALLRKRFKLIQLLQIPVCIVFGFMTDVAMELLGWVVVRTYWQQWLVCIAGIVFVAFGVSCYAAGGRDGFGAVSADSCQIRICENYGRRLAGGDRGNAFSDIFAWFAGSPGRNGRGGGLCGNAGETAQLVYDTVRAETFQKFGKKKETAGQIS